MSGRRCGITAPELVILVLSRELARKINGPDVVPGYAYPDTLGGLHM
jgi:hypothetical protein